ncbi:MAG: cysteine desulfurase [Chloroflexi bacterium]|nr:cysteine desulfurase [Chloroflexota bacterium]
MIDLGHKRSLQTLREDFPVLQRSENGKSLVYLDSAATSQRPRQVVEAMTEYYLSYNANVHRGVYALSEEATAKYEAARAAVARFIGARSPREVIFVRNATEAINLVAYSWGRANVREGDLIVTTVLEHHSNLVPWQLLTAERGARVQVVGVDDTGQLRMDELRDLLAQRPKLVAFTHVSNALGTVNPAAEIAELAHQAGAVVLLDGAQSVPHRRVNLQNLGCDFLAFSGHKMLGPTGIGVLWGRRELLQAMPPFLAGGDMIRSVDLSGATWNDLPWKFEAGTPAIAQAIGLGRAVEYLENVSLAAVERHELELTTYALERLRHVKKLRLFGPAADQRGGVVSFEIEGIHPHDVASLLDREGVAARAGHHCCQPLMNVLGVPATTRASFYLYNTPADVDRLVEAVEKAKRVFGI